MAARTHEVEVVIGRIVRIEKNDLIARQEGILNIQVPQIECIAYDFTNFGLKLGTFFLESAYVFSYFLCCLARVWFDNSLSISMAISLTPNSGMGKFLFGEDGS